MNEEYSNKIKRNIFNRIAALVLWLIGIKFVSTLVLSFIAFELLVGGDTTNSYVAGYNISGKLSPILTVASLLIVIVLAPFGVLKGTQKYRSTKKSNKANHDGTA